MGTIALIRSGPTPPLLTEPKKLHHSLSEGGRRAAHRLIFLNTTGTM